MQTTRKAQTAFTLVELMIVIAVVAVLIAVLLPSLKKAREAAQKLACASNEHQLAVAFVSYNTDWKGYYPYAWNYSSTAPTEAASNYVVAIYGYLGQYKISTERPKVLWCPANSWVPPLNATSTGMSPTYGLNGGVMPFSGSGTTGGPVLYPRIRNRQISYPSQVLLVGETPAAAVGTTKYGANVKFLTTFWTSPTLFRYPYTNLRPATNGTWYDFEVAQGGDTPVTRTNHQQGWNSLMFDGSVNYATRTALINASTLFWSDQ